MSENIEEDLGEGDIEFLKRRDRKIKSIRLNKELIYSGKRYCGSCDKIKIINKFHKVKGKQGGVDSHCKECRKSRINTEQYKEYQRNYRFNRSHIDEKFRVKCNKISTLSIKELRLKIVRLLGDICIRCGCKDERVLQIDHIKGGGCRERIRAGSSTTHYREILKSLDKNLYQVLCANCNWIKKLERNENAKVYFDSM